MIPGLPVRTVTNLGRRELEELQKASPSLRLQTFVFGGIYLLYTVFAVGFILYAGIALGVFTSEMVILLGLIAFMALHWFVLRPWIARKAVDRLLKQTGERTCTVDVGEDRFLIHVEGDKISGDETFLYSALTAVVETPAFFFAFVGRPAVVLDKKPMTPEQISAVRAALQGAVPPNKYKQR